MSPKRQPKNTPSQDVRVEIARNLPRMFHDIILKFVDESKHIDCENYIMENYYK